MNQASQQSNKLVELIDDLLAELKSTWQVSHNDQDPRARTLIDGFAQSLIRETTDNISTEEFDIQKKVLAKTREKTEALIKQLESLEAKQD